MTLKGTLGVNALGRLSLTNIDRVPPMSQDAPVPTVGEQMLDELRILNGNLINALEAGASQSSVEFDTTAKGQVIPRVKAYSGSFETLDAILAKAREVYRQAVAISGNKEIKFDPDPDLDDLP